MVQNIERELALAQTILSPAYLRSKIEEYKRERERVNNMIRWYRRALKELEDPKSHSYQVSKRYKLQ